MRKYILFLVGILISSFAMASSVALVYEGEKNVLDKKSILGTVVEGGVVIPADSLSSPKSALFAGPVGGPLRGASLLRMDLQLNMAFIVLGEATSRADLQSAHSTRAGALSAFLPTTTPAIVNGQAESGVAALPAVSDGPFKIKINNQLIGSDPIVLKKRFKKSKIKLDVIYTSSAPIWNVEIELESTPKLSFWKEGKKVGLNEVPQTKFSYIRQVFFRPLSSGRSIQIPIEVLYIDEEDYVWTFHIKSKDIQTEQKVRVKFNQPKK